MVEPTVVLLEFVEKKCILIYLFCIFYELKFADLFSGGELLQLTAANAQTEWKYEEDRKGTARVFGFRLD